MNLTPEQETLNDFIGLMHARDKDSPAKTWWNAAPWHDATDRALGIDRTQDGGQFAVFPFRAAKIDDKWRVLAAYPAPKIISDVDEDWLGIDQVISWCPLSNHVEVMGDPVDQLVGNPAGFYAEKDTGTLYGQPRAFFQAWARDRARFYGFAAQHIGKSWSAMPHEPDLVPGALIVGDARKIRWSAHTLPANVECVGCDPAEINRAMLRNLNLPRLRAGMTSNSKAAA